MAKKRATKKLAGKHQRTINAKVRFLNPVILDGTGFDRDGTVIPLVPELESFREEAIDSLRSSLPDMTDDNLNAFEDEIYAEMISLQDSASAGGPLETIRSVIDSYNYTDRPTALGGLYGAVTIKRDRPEQPLREN